MTDVEQSEDEVRFRRDADGQWKWQVRAGNHEVIAASTEGYLRWRDAAANFERVTGRKAPQP